MKPPQVDALEPDDGACVDVAWVKGAFNHADINIAKTELAAADAQAAKPARRWVKELLTPSGWQLASAPAGEMTADEFKSFVTDLRAQRSGFYMPHLSGFIVPHRSNSRRRKVAWAPPKELVERGRKLLPVKRRLRLAHGFAAEAETAIDLAGMGRLQKHTVGIAVGDALGALERAVADRSLNGSSASP